MAVTLQDRVHAAIRADILAGRFRPGQRLKIRDLAASLDTSPMPVRAALQRLVAEGALEAEALRSVRVPALSRAGLENLLPVRLALEGLAAEAAGARIDAAGIATLTAGVARMDQALGAHDFAAYLTENSQFHLTLYRAAGNPVLLRMIEQLWLQAGPAFTWLVTSDDLSPRLNSFHRDCLAALADGDGRAARAAIEADLRYFGQHLLMLLDLDPAHRNA
ncbi:MAG: GntR family transcriptional regulator [Alphaproteobacteria bacterium HGW-Alphaproteobacteria-6]|nr:MAG: GntR family transcriptional regulator [Alphaproteobacteria bacterium HGW-Alphaproteobacteria-6]